MQLLTRVTLSGVGSTAVESELCMVLSCSHKLLNSTVPVKRHRGEPGHTRDTRDTRAHAGTRNTTNLTTIHPNPSGHKPARKPNRTKISTTDRTHARARALTHSLTHSPTHSPTHSLTLTPTNPHSRGAGSEAHERTKSLEVLEKRSSVSTTVRSSSAPAYSSTRN